jgi:DNA polymerase IV
VDAIDTVLLGLVDRVTERMRVADRIGRTVVLRLRFDDFTRATRSHTLADPTSQTQVVLETARDLLAAATPMIERQGLTLVGISVANLDTCRALQLTLPVDRYSSNALDLAVDEIRKRFGRKAITRAVLVGRDEGMIVPLLPD